MFSFYFKIKLRKWNINVFKGTFELSKVISSTLS